MRFNLKSSLLKFRQVFNHTPAGRSWNCPNTLPNSHPPTQPTLTPNAHTHSAGGLVEGLVVELSNGQPAVVVAITPEAVRLDANGVFAGRQLVFELKLTGIEKGV